MNRAVFTTASIASLCLVTSCGSGGRSFVELPDHQAATTVLIHREGGDAAFELSVSTSGLPFVAEIDANSEAFLLGYELRPEALGLEAGGSPRCAVLLPRYKARLEAGRFEELVGPLPEAVARALIADPERCSPCRPVRMHAVSYPENGTLKAGAWLDSGPLVSHLPGGFRRVDETSSTLIDGCSLGTGVANISAMTRVDANRHWVGSELGELGLVRFDEGAESCVVETSTIIVPLRLDEPNPGVITLRMNLFALDTEALYALVDDGRILRYAAGEVRTLGIVPVHPLDLERGGSFVGQMLPLPDDRALAIAGWNKIAWWGPEGIERVDEVELPFNQFAADGGQRVTSLAIDETQSPSRLLAGSSSGLVLSFDESARAWNRIQEVPTIKELRALEYFDGRWLIIIEQGDVAVWHPETGMCPELFRMPLATNSGLCIHRARRGNQLAIFDAIGDNTRPTGVVWIEDP